MINIKTKKKKMAQRDGRESTMIRVMLAICAPVRPEKPEKVVKLYEAPDKARLGQQLRHSAICSEWQTVSVALEEL